jgi:NAD(P)H-dependent FMN reductase
MNTPLNIKIILGSTREGRFGDKPAHWILGELQKYATEKKDGGAAITTELLDLRDYPLPFFNEPMSPSMIKEPYANPAVQKWTAKIAEGDAFIIVTPEYNHGYPAVLKNALDYVYKEWNRKAVGFVGWGSAGGARSIQQLRQVAIELQMAPIRASIHIPVQVYMAIMKENVPASPELFEPVNATKDTFIEQLIWWASALKTARA